MYRLALLEGFLSKSACGFEGNPGVLVGDVFISAFAQQCSTYFSYFFGGI